MAATEIYTNNAATTVTSGGTTASSGTQTWTVASSSSFPAASSGGTPPTQFHVGDPAAPGELVAVTNVSGNTWTVTRGAESTTPVAHAPGFTVYGVITAGGLNSLAPAQAAPAGFTPANPTGSTSTSLVMMGLGSTCTYTPASSGIVLVNVTGYGTTLGAVAQLGVGARYGTSTPPVNGTAVTGTRFGGIGDGQIRPTAASFSEAFAFTGLLTGLIPATTYWFDVAISTSNPADAGTISSVSMTMVELPQ